MDRENKYYNLIESMIKAHRKFSGYEMILEDIIDDVYNHSAVVIDSIKDENVINAYLQKVVSTSIITVPKRMNYRKELNYRQITNTPEVVQTTQTQKEELPESVVEKKPIIEEQLASDEPEMEQSVIDEPAIDEPVLEESENENLSFVDDELEEFVLESNDEDTEEDNVVPKANQELVDKMINSIDADSVIETDSLQETESLPEEIVQEDVIEDIEEQKINYSDVSNVDNLDMLDVEEENEQLEEQSEELELEENSTSIEPEEEDLLEETESAILEQEDTELNDSAFLDENTEENELIEEEPEINKSEELELVSDDVEEEIDGNITEEESGFIEDDIEETELNGSLDDEINEPEDIVLEEPDDNLNLAEISELNAAEEALPENDNLVSENIEPEIEEVTDDGGQDIGLESAFDINMEVPSGNEFDNIAADDAVDLLIIDETDDLQEQDTETLQQDEYKKLDYSVFNYNPSQNDNDVDVNSISNSLVQLDEANPDLNILQVFDLRYKQNLSIERISGELQVEKKYVIAALDKIMDII